MMRFIQGKMPPQKIPEQMQSAAENCSYGKFVFSIAHRNSLARQITNAIVVIFVIKSSSNNNRNMQGKRLAVI